jgi:phage baseplate assembly protein W
MITYNIRFPINDDVYKNRFFSMTQITKEALGSDLLLLLLTEKGERYYQPDYGTNLLKYIFEPNDNITSKDVEKEIKRTVSLYIPTLTINTIEFNKVTDEQGNPIQENQLNVKIKFTYTEGTFSEGGELDINF